MIILKLDWIRNPRALEANTPFGTYTIRENGLGKTSIYFNNILITSEARNYVDARTIAQQDFEERVMDCIKTN